MSDPLSDFAMHEAQGPEIVAGPEDGWLARRTLSFGASEVASVLVGMGSPLTHENVWKPSHYVRKNAKMQRVGSVQAPRIVLEKAGLKRPLKRGAVMRRGNDLEVMLVDQWRRLVERGRGGIDSELIDAETISHVASVIPRNVLPLVDRHCPALSCTPDVWCFDILGRLVMVDAKCSVHPYHEKWGGCPPHVRFQLQAQMAVCGADAAICLEGEGWGAEWKDHAGEPSGPVVAWGVERCETTIAEIREQCGRAWSVVERLRAEAEGKAA